ncbi:MAG: Nitrogen fixation regulation protein FixK [Phycisphaerae bacterium]|nr:Nitrogen fixation regulation protein FixK [Phycisphaerae bacterium]
MTGSETTTAARELLIRCWLFKNLPGKWLETLADLAQFRRYPAGTIIFREGEECPGIYVVAEGRVRVYKLAASGKEHILHFADVGMTFAEVAAIGHFPCPASAEAIEECRCLLLPMPEVQALLNQHHDLCRHLLTGMTFWIRQLVGLLEDLVLRDATSRLAGYLLRFAESVDSKTVVLPMSKKDLANHLNLTSETLSRTLRRLADIGAIELPDHQKIQLLQMQKLQAIADGTPPAEFE